MAVLAALALAASLAGCGSMIASLPYIGEAPEAQNRPEVRPDYPDAFPRPPGETELKPMNTEERTRLQEERAKLQAELTAARDRAAAERREQISQPERR